MHLDKFKQYSGRLSYGKTATSQPVILRLRGGGIEVDAGLNIAEGGKVEHWAYDKLLCGVPLTAKSSEALLTSSDHPGATLFVADHDFAANLRTLAPQICAKASRMIGLKPAGGITAAVAALAGIIYVTDYSPAKTIASVMPERARTLLGARVVTNMTKKFKHCTEPEGRRALDAMMKRLSDAAGLKKPFEVTVVNWGLVNAFAAPGGQLVLTRGLIQKAKSADMVAGVMAHEMGHGIELHPEAGLVRALGLSAASEFFFTGSSSGLKNIGLVLATFKFSRNAEREADKHALATLRKAGISQKALAAFFKEIATKSGKSSIGKIMRKYKFLSTHPASLERAKMMAAQPAYAATPALDKNQWKALREICGKRKRYPTAAEIAAKNRKAIETTSSLLAKTPNDIEALKRRARAYTSLKQYENAIKDYNHLVTLEPDKAGHFLSLAKLHLRLKQWDQEVENYGHAIRLAPDRFYYYTGRARALEKLGKLDQAIKDYTSAIALSKNNSYLYVYRGRLHAKRRDWDAAFRSFDKAIELKPKYASHYIARARAKREKGDLKGSINDINTVIKLRPKSALAYMERGTTLIKQNKGEDAIADLSKAVSLSPRYLIAFTRRGQAYELVGDRDAALADYRMAVALKARSKAYKAAQETARQRIRALTASKQ